jgi:8-oxo-dGTP diphosphatase
MALPYDEEEERERELRKNPHRYPFARPVVAVDGVIFGFDPEDDVHPLKVLLIKRGGEPFKGSWALPGGKLEVNDEEDQGEDLEEGARRELEEETHVKVAYLEQLYTFGKPRRDPRCRVISVAYFGLVRTADCDVQGDDDADDAQWFSVVGALQKSALTLAFDHDEILKMAVSRLQSKIRYAPIGFNLLPEEGFTLGQLQQLYEAILFRPLDKRNFQKRILRMGILTVVGVASGWKEGGPPPRLYTFNQESYDFATKRGFNFEV